MAWECSNGFLGAFGTLPKSLKQRVLSSGFLLENKTDLGRRDHLWRTQEMLIQLLAMPGVPRVFLGRLPCVPLKFFHLHSQMMLLLPQHLLPALSLGTVCVGSSPDLCLHSIHHTVVPAELGSKRTLEWMIWWEEQQLGNIIYKVSSSTRQKHWNILYCSKT